MSHLLPIIGLEIHVRLKTQSKMFCSCPNVADSAAVNTAICPVCTGQPGALPAVNAEAVRLGVRAGLSLGCRIPDQAQFDRKNYFYPDLPKGYQISQFDFPICIGGALSLDVPGGLAPRERIRVGLTRAHLEEDAAKNIHDGGDSSTLVDFNRAGTPLLEIVTEPDIRTPQEAKAFLQELQAILRTVGSSEADMEKGFMRCDANISLLPVDDDDRPLQTGLNPKVEIKNLNSFRAVERALTFEIERQKELYAKNELPIGATRGWDEDSGATFEQRTKETTADYRYFPEPDLKPLELVTIREEESQSLPELPEAKRLRLQLEWGFIPDDARVLVANDWTDYAEETMGELLGWLESSDDSTAEREEGEKARLAKLTGSWLINKLAGLLTQKQISLQESHITPENFSEFLHLIENGTLGSANAQRLLLMMLETGCDPSHLMEENNLGQISDPAQLRDTITQLIAQNPNQVAQIKAGKIALIKWFVGTVMKATEGRANPEMAEAEIKRQMEI